MKSLSVICVGKIRTSYWKDAAEHYIKLTHKWINIEYIEIKDGDPSLSVQNRNLQEGQRILAKLDPQNITIACHEKGEYYSSKQFSTQIRKWHESCDKLAFIIGGPYGIDKTVLDQCSCIISFSAMTFPHELARVILLEQIYRSQCILHNVPYHH